MSPVQAGVQFPRVPDMGQCQFHHVIQPYSSNLYLTGGLIESVSLTSSILPGVLVWRAL